MLLAILSCCTAEELEESSSDEEKAEDVGAENEAAQRRAAIKNKILAVGRMRRMFQLLRFVYSVISVKSRFNRYLGHIERRLKLRQS